MINLANIQLDPSVYSDISQKKAPTLHKSQLPGQLVMTIYNPARYLFKDFFFLYFLVEPFCVRLNTKPATRECGC